MSSLPKILLQIPRSYDHVVFSDVKNRIPTYAKQRKMEWVIKSSIECFSKHGMEKTTLKMIAKHAGISDSKIVYHFGNKANLEVTCIQYIWYLYQKSVLDKIKQTSSSQNWFHLYLDACYAWPLENLTLSVVWIQFYYLCMKRQSYKKMNTVAKKNGRHRLIELFKNMEPQNDFETPEKLKLIDSIHRNIWSQVMSLLTEEFSDKNQTLEIYKGHILHLKGLL